MRAIQKEGKALWVSGPVSIWKNDEGQTNIKQLIQFEAKLQKKIESEILKAYEGLTHEN